MNNMSERNEFLEMDGLYWESETHEWFHDKTSTQYARKKSILWGSGEQNDALNVICFVVRDKESGEYNRLMLDKDSEDVIFDTKSLEAMGYEIDRMKVIKRFNVKN
jgi:hypothetical protein